MKSFHEILEENLQQTKKKNLNFSFFSSDNAYELDLKPNLFEFFQRKNSSLYAKKACFSSYNIRTKIITHKPHVLNPKQKSALDWFKSRGIHLSEGFSKAELTKSFRQLAFVLHPDYNSQTESHSLYQSLHENKEILMQIFNTNE